MLLVQRLQFEDYFYGVWVFEHWGAPEHFLRSVTKTDLHFIRNTWVEIVKTGLRRYSGDKNQVDSVGSRGMNRGWGRSEQGTGSCVLVGGSGGSGI